MELTTGNQREIKASLFLAKYCDEYDKKSSLIIYIVLYIYIFLFHTQVK
jgi:hypothetical protein